VRILRALVVLIVAGLALALVLYWTAPAELAYRAAASRLGGLRIEGISGSVWSGSAQQVSSYGQALGALHWEVDKIAALRGDVQSSFVLSGKDVTGQARISGQGRDFSLRDLHGEFPAILLGPALDIPALSLQGKIALDFAQVDLRDGYIAAADGSAVWREIAVGGITSAAVPGLQARFTTAADQVTGVLSDLGGPFELNGTVSLQGNRYSTLVTIKVREPNPQMEEVLKFIGEHNPDGGSLLRVEGEIKRLY
jgi:general secretion pathway protein N